MLGFVPRLTLLAQATHPKSGKTQNLIALLPTLMFGPVQFGGELPSTQNQLRAPCQAESV